jgi:membrane-associated HD superfamily phosphohydrolase
VAVSAPLEKIHAVLPGRWDFDALRAGTGVTLAFAVPFFVVAALLNSDSNDTNTLLFFGFVLGFTLGAGCAAWVQRVGAPFSHGIVTASGTFIVVQAVLILVAFVRSSTINWLSIFFTLTLVAFAGLIGGILGNRLQRRGFVPSQRRGR